MEPANQTGSVCCHRTHQEAASWQQLLAHLNLNHLHFNKSPTDPLRPNLWRPRKTRTVTHTVTHIVTHTVTHID